MKLFTKIQYILITAVLAMTLTLAACGGGGTASTDTDPVRELETVDLTDNRVLTDVSDYESRYVTAFSLATAVNETDVTYTVKDDGTACVTGYTGGETVVVLPETLGGHTVTEIAENAFNEAGFRALYIPETVRKIGFGALTKCTGLTTLKTPVVSAPDANWFGSLFGATSYEINRAYVPSSLQTLIVTGSAMEIPTYCFYGCSDLEAVGLLTDTDTLGAFAFYGCDRLVHMSLPEGLTEIGDYAFGQCFNLLGLTVPNTVVRMGRSMLEGCAALETLTVPYVGATADNTENAWLGYLFGATAHTFSEGYVPSSLIRVTVTDCVSLPANAFFECSHIREIVLPDTLVSVGHRAFYRCAYLSAVTFPASLTSLGDEAFSGCIRLVSVDLSHVDTLGVQVFRNCYSLSDVVLPACEVPVYTFDGTPYGRKN